MVSFIDEHRVQLEVESICSQLPIAPSTYYHHKALETDPEGRADRYPQDVRFLRRRFRGCGRKTSASTVLVRSGGNFAVRALMLLVAP